MINLIGDHATYHKKYDAPLNSDIEGLSGPISHWYQTVPTASDLPQAAAEAAQVARTAPGQISTLIIPADCAWDESVAPVAALPVPARASVDDESIKTAAELSLIHI